MPKNRTSACGRMLEHVLPPNVPADTMQGIIVGSLAIGALTAAIDFTVHYAATYRGMFYWDGRLMDTALMGPFSAYVEPVVIVFGVVVLLALLSAVMLYSSYYLGGRSIYLMRRLPDGRQTLRRQVWTAPLVWAVCAVAAAAVVLGLCYLAWRFITPEQCIPTAENIQRVMNAIAASPMRTTTVKEGSHMLEISHISKKYGSKEALHDVSLTLPQGQIVGLFGENGAGKTTLMKCVLGLVRHEGTVTLDGTAIDRTNIDRLSFATCEHSFFPGLTAAAHRDFYAAHFPRFNDKRFHGLMDFFSLPMDKKLRSFSAGMQNQFEVIMALSQGADYILMDEPFAGNDIFNREDFYKVLLGILTERETVLLSTHLIEEVKDCISRAVLIREGGIVGDCSAEELEESGRDLMGYIKETYHYRPERVSQALDALTDGEEGEDA